MSTLDPARGSRVEPTIDCFLASAENLGEKSSALAHAYSELYGLLFSGFSREPNHLGRGRACVDRGGY